MPTAYCVWKINTSPNFYYTKSYLHLTKIDQRPKISSPKHKSGDWKLSYKQRGSNLWIFNDLSPKCYKVTKESKHDNKQTMYDSNSNLLSYLTHATTLLDAKNRISQCWQQQSKRAERHLPGNNEARKNLHAWQYTAVQKKKKEKLKTSNILVKMPSLLSCWKQKKKSTIIKCVKQHYANKENFSMIHSSGMLRMDE